MTFKFLDAAAFFGKKLQYSGKRLKVVIQLMDACKVFNIPLRYDRVVEGCVSEEKKA